MKTLARTHRVRQAAVHPALSARAWCPVCQIGGHSPCREQRSSDGPIFLPLNVVHASRFGSLGHNCQPTHDAHRAPVLDGLSLQSLAEMGRGFPNARVD